MGVLNKHTRFSLVSNYDQETLHSQQWPLLSQLPSNKPDWPQTSVGSAWRATCLLLKTDNVLEMCSYFQIENLTNLCSRKMSKIWWYKGSDKVFNEGPSSLILWKTKIFLSFTVQHHLVWGSNSICIVFPSALAYVSISGKRPSYAHCSKGG